MNHAIQIVASKLHEVGPFVQEQLKGGISGDEVVLVSTPTSRFVVRSFPHKSASQRSREISCFRIASESGYGPHVCYFDVEQGILVMECLEKHILSDEQRESDSLYIDLAHLIQRIHRGPSFPTNVNIFEKIQKNIDSIMFAHSVVPVLAIEELSHSIAEVIKNDSIITPCHFDLNSNNIMIRDRGLLAIDFETAAQGESFFDVASVAITYCFTKKHEQQLLEAYLEHKPSDQEMAKFCLMKLVVWIDSAMELLKMYRSEIQSYPLASEDNYSEFFSKIAKKAEESGFDFNSSKLHIDVAKVVINHVLMNSRSEEFLRSIAKLRKT